MVRFEPSFQVRNINEVDTINKLPSGHINHGKVRNRFQDRNTNGVDIIHQLPPVHIYYVNLQNRFSGSKH